MAARRPANQVLPPLMPGYDPDYKGYPYDVAKAKALHGRSRPLKDGFSTVLYAMNTDPNPRIAQAIQQDLAAIGIKAEIRALAKPKIIAAGGNQRQAAMIWSGGMAWIADFPDPSNFYGPILGCAGAIQGGWNWSWYLQQGDRGARLEADCHVRPEAEGGARQGCGRSIFTDIRPTRLDPDLQRAPRGREVEAHGRAGAASISTRPASSTTTRST